jgi:antitoxin component of MazEF toxin-antitoxin module
MPLVKVHCKRCEEKYGYDFKEINAWMDAPSLIMGGNHQSVRHDVVNTPKKAETMFKNKIPEKYRIFIKDVVLDHIILDKKQRMINSKKQQKTMIPKGITTKIRRRGTSLVVTIPMYLLRYFNVVFESNVYVRVDKKIYISKNEKKGFLARKIRVIGVSYVISVPSQFALAFGFEANTDLSAKFENDMIVFERV